MTAEQTRGRERQEMLRRFAAVVAAATDDDLARIVMIATAVANSRLLEKEKAASWVD